MIDWNEFKKSLATDVELDQIKLAYYWASSLHKGQRRKYEDEPYFIHPVRVAQYLGDQSIDLIIAGLLHDVLEKTRATSEEIVSRFGHNVEKLVLGVSKIEGRTMKEAFQLVVDTHPQTITLRVADRIDNTKTKYRFLPQNRKADYQLENEIILDYAKKYRQTALLETLVETIELSQEE